MAQFERRKNDDGTDEDAYLWIARQINMATPYELTALFIIRDDEKQRRAMEMAQQAHMARWTRNAVFAAIWAVSVTSVVAIVAAFIARG